MSTGSKQFRLVNYAAKTKTLSFDEGKFQYSRCLNNSTWTLVKINVQVFVDYYYDYGYRLRWQNKEVDDPAISQAAVEKAIENTYHVSIIMNTPELFRSFADQCAPSVTKDTIIDDYSCDNAKTPKECLENAKEVDGAHKRSVHHRSDSAALDYLHTIKGSEKTINMLLSGYMPCSVKRDSNGNILGHATRLIGGIAWNYTCVAFYPDDNTNYTKPTTVLHEISHILGAVSQNNCPADTNHGDCVMSYNANETTLMNLWNSGEYRKLYCNACYNAIVNNMKQF